MRSFWDGQPELARELACVRETILARAVTEDAEVREAIRLLLESGGKMLRPAFVLLSSRFGTPDPPRIVRVAAAVEMLHMATLVHDDIIDGAARRRGVATLHTLHGARKAVLVGDWLFASCFALIADMARMENAQSLARIVARICGSEISQSADRFLVHTSPRRYLRRIAGKTAALFALSFYVGAFESGCPPGTCAILRRLGYCLGMGFQIIDDILDFRHLGSESGKPTGSDLAQGIYTLPAILALSRDADGRLAAALSRRASSRRALSRATRLIEERDGIAGAREMARRYTERSLREIRRLPASPARTTLEDVTTKLLHRSY
jgi:heptaprenyl diphosphate synthase